MAFRQLRTSGGGTYVKWDTPKTVKGVLVGFESKDYKGQKTTTLILKQSDGSVIKVNGSAQIERSGLYYEQPGVSVELVFKGKGTTKGGLTYNDIEVYVDSPEPDPSTRPTLAPAATGAATVAGSGIPGSLETYDTLVARLQVSNPNGAKAVLAALEGMSLSSEQKADKLREFLKVQG